MADLKNKVALVTGASRGIGKGIAEGLAEAGATVYVVARSGATDAGSEASTVQECASQVDALGGHGVPVALDLRDDEALGRLFADIEKASGRLDLLVNNAYQLPEPDIAGQRFWEAPLSLWDDQYQAGLRGAYAVSRLAARLMTPARRGLIINISSRGAAEYMLNTAYGVIKAAVDRMTRDMALELAGCGVSVLSLWPGLTGTEGVLRSIAEGRLRANANAIQSPRFIGRCVAALAMDPDIAEKSGGSYQVAELAREYRFTDPGLDPQPVPRLDGSGND